MNIAMDKPTFKSNVMVCSFFCLALMSCSQPKKHAKDDSGNKPDYVMKNQTITVDGEMGEWEKIKPVEVNSKNNIWIGDGLPEGVWKGEQDLSFYWKGAHHDGKLFFLIVVKDDTLSKFDQEYAWLNDCVEIHLDHQGLKGERIVGIGPDNSLEDRFGKRLRGHEMQFLPTQPAKAFFNDSKNIYYTDSAQNLSFQKEWHGDIMAKKTKDGYIIEMGFAIPNFYAKSGQMMGMDMAVCDDDGKGRQSLMVWSGYKGQFWLTMDNFKGILLE